MNVILLFAAKAALQVLHLLGRDTLHVDANASADAGRGDFGGRVDGSDADRHVAYEFKESDVERVGREVGSKVTTIIDSGSVRLKGDVGERLSIDGMRLKAVSC